MSPNGLGKFKFDTDASYPERKDNTKERENGEIKINSRVGVYYAMCSVFDVLCRAGNA